jgi:putative glutamate/gamma-aminobutyrate antiporter
LKAKESKKTRALSVFTLAMINLAALGTIRNWPITAEYGLSSVSYLLLAAIVFFIPVALVAAELATGWPKSGGVYVWVKEAFGHRTGFLAIWLLWIENVLWYPTILSFLAATIGYVFSPALANNKEYMTAMILLIFWGCTLTNMLGMKTSSRISTFSVIFGTFIAGFVIIGLGCLWVFSGKPLQLAFSKTAFLPSHTSLKDIVFFTGVILSFSGMEMSAIHARDVQNPQKDYPRAILVTVITIITLTILGVLSIAIVIPKDQINLAAGSLQAFSYFVSSLGMPWLIPIMALMIATGGVGTVSTWVTGPIKGLLAAARSGDLPPYFRRVNSHGMPVNLMVLQACIVSVISLMFIFMPSISSAYLLITVVVSQLYLIMYVLMFLSAIKLRYKKPNVERPYRIPFGKVGVWVVSIMGCVGAVFTFFVGFIPPSDVPASKNILYIAALIATTAFFTLAPWIILKFKKEHWNHPLAHEK